MMDGLKEGEIWIDLKLFKNWKNKMVWQNEQWTIPFLTIVNGNEINFNTILKKKKGNWMGQEEKKFNDYSSGHDEGRDETRKEKIEDGWWRGGYKINYNTSLKHKQLGEQWCQSAEHRTASERRTIPANIL